MISLFFASNIQSVTSSIKEVVNPIIYILSGIGGLVCTLLLIFAGIQYITSSGDIDKLERSKKIIRNAAIGVSIILASLVITSLFTHAYGGSPATIGNKIPSLNSLQPNSTSLGLVDVLIKAITGVLENVVQSIGKPFIDALNFFTNSTPLMADNSDVFNMWVITATISDSLFILTLVLIGFNVMSASCFGFEELDIKHILPQAGLIFLLINSSIFAIDTLISFSNGLITALKSGLGNVDIWSVLSQVTNHTGTSSLATLIIMIVFLALAFILLVYYVGRIVTLYLGAVLAPMVLLLWLLPSFKDFATNAVKTYIITIFVLFVHVVILLLAASIFNELNKNSNINSNSLMDLVIGMSTLIALLKTQGVLAQMNYASIGPKSIRRLSSQFINSFSIDKLSYKEI